MKTRHVVALYVATVLARCAGRLFMYSLGRSVVLTRPNAKEPEVFS